MSSDYLYDHADAYNYIESDGLYPQQVDDFLALFTFNPETLEKIEKRIIEEADIEKNIAAENKDDLSTDITTLQDLIADNKLVSSTAISAIYDIIEQLKSKM